MAYALWTFFYRYCHLSTATFIEVPVEGLAGGKNISSSRGLQG